MPASKRSLSLLVLVAAWSQPLAAEIRVGEKPSNLAGHFWSIVSDVSSRLRQQNEPAPRTRPQPIPQGGSTVDLNDLNRPTLVEQRIRAALEPKEGKLQITIPGGRARQGDFSLGSSEELNGHLLVA